MSETKSVDLGDPIPGQEYLTVCQKPEDLFGKREGLLARLVSRGANILFSRLVTAPILPLRGDFKAADVYPGSDFRYNDNSRLIVEDFARERGLDSRVISLSNLYKVYRGEAHLLTDEEVELIANHLDDLLEYAKERVLRMNFDPAAGFTPPVMRPDPGTDLTVARVRIGSMVDEVGERVRRNLSAPQDFCSDPIDLFGREIETRRGPKLLLNQRSVELVKAFAQIHGIEEAFSLENLYQLYSGRLEDVDVIRIILPKLPDFSVVAKTHYLVDKSRGAVKIGIGRLLKTAVTMRMSEMDFAEMIDDMVRQMQRNGTSKIYGIDS